MATVKDPTPQRAGGRPSRDEIVKIVARKFLLGDRIDMQGLAAELGIGRATLYRRVRDRDQLIAEAIWSFSGPYLNELAASTRRKRGSSRIQTVIRQWGTDLARLNGVRDFLEREPVAALRILTTGATDIQAWTIGFIAALLREEQSRGALDLPVDVDTLAEAILCIGNSYFYAEVIAGGEPDIEKAVKFTNLLLASTSYR